MSKAPKLPSEDTEIASTQTDDAKPAAQGAEVSGPLAQIPIEIVVSVGRARPQVRDLLRLRRESILPLDRRVEDPVELYIGDRLIARGLLEEQEGERSGLLAVRITEVADLNSGL